MMHSDRGTIYLYNNIIRISNGDSSAILLSNTSMAVNLIFNYAWHISYIFFENKISLGSLSNMKLPMAL